MGKLCAGGVHVRCGTGLGVLAAAPLLSQPKLKLCIRAPLVFLGELEEGCCEDALDVR